MTLPLIDFTKGCCGFFPEEDKTPTTTCEKIKICALAGSLVLDILGTITLLVLGVLAVTKVLSLPPAATYSMFGGAGLAISLWAIMLIKDHCSKKP